MEKKEVLKDLELLINKENKSQRTSFNKDDFLYGLMDVLETTEKLLLEKKKTGKTVDWLRKERKQKDEIENNSVLIEKAIKEANFAKKNDEKKIVWLREQKNLLTRKNKKLKEKLSIKKDIDKFKVDYLYKSNILSLSSKKLVSIKSFINKKRYRVTLPLSSLYNELSLRNDIFNSALYLTENQDVASNNICPLYHFLMNGIIEERMLEKYPEFYLNIMQFIKKHYSI